MESFDWNTWDPREPTGQVKTPSIVGFFTDWLGNRNLRSSNQYSLPGASGTTYPYQGDNTTGAYKLARELAVLRANFSAGINMSPAPIAEIGPKGSTLFGGFSPVAKTDLVSGQPIYANTMQTGSLPWSHPSYGAKVTDVTLTNGTTVPYDQFASATGPVEVIPEYKVPQYNGNTIDNSNLVVGQNGSAISPTDFAGTQGQPSIPLSNTEQLLADQNQLMRERFDYQQQQDAEAKVFRDEMAPWGKAQVGMQIASSGLQALSGLYNAYMAKKNYDLAKEEFAFNKDFALVNLENQAKTVNEALTDRQFHRYSQGGFATPEEYMQVNAVRGRL